MVRLDVWLEHPAKPTAATANQSQTNQNHRQPFQNGPGTRQPNQVEGSRTAEPSRLQIQRSEQALSVLSRWFVIRLLRMVRFDVAVSGIA